MAGPVKGSYQLSILRSWHLCREDISLHVAPRQQRLIAALAIEGPCLRGSLVGLLWPDHTEALARESLRVSVHLVVRQLPDLLVCRGATVSLGDFVEIDVEAARRSMREVNLRRGQGDDDVHTLMSLRRAELLPGWYDDWVIHEQDAWRRERLHDFQLIARSALAAAAYETAVIASEAALEIDPLYESSVLLLMQAEMHQGNKAKAIRVFHDYGEQLMKEIGVLPTGGIRRLVDLARGKG